MKKLTLIYGIIGLGFVLIILSYFIDSDILYNTTIYYFTGLAIIAIITKILAPLIYWLFYPVSKTYKVKKGKHYSGIRIKPFYKSKNIKLKVKFYNTCWYDIKKYGDHVNKLYGIGDFNIHKNSDRIGWRPSDKIGYIDLFKYKYRDSQRTIEKFRTIKVLKYFDIETDAPEYKFGRHTFFYYGGIPEAHEDMVCDIIFK